METETVDELAAGTGGVWKVTTQGSEHVWNLDASTYTRIPGAASLSDGFDYDNVAHKITRVDIYPKVGGVARVWLDDPDNPLEIEQFRQSSTVAKIERVG